MIDLSNVSGISKSKPASNDEIRIVENEMNILLPESYKELLKLTNGFLTDRGLVVYGTESIFERNETLEVEKYSNGYVAIGDDSGDIVFLISKDNTKEELLLVGCGDMNTLNAKYAAASLSKWLNNNCSLNEIGKKDETQTYNQYYSIILTGITKGGLKDLVKIKNVLNMDMSAAGLLKVSKNLPFVMISNVSYGKALNYLKKLTEFSEILQLKGLECN